MGNRIFGGGYLMIGVGVMSRSDNVLVSGNFIHLQADEPDDRWPEYGAQAGVNGFRQTWGGANLVFENNWVSVLAQDGGYARGVWQDQAVSTITPGGVIEVGDRFIITMYEKDRTNGQTLTVEASSTSIAALCTQIANAINTSALSNFQTVTAYATATNVELVEKVSGTGFVTVTSTTEIGREHV